MRLNERVAALREKERIQEAGEEAAEALELAERVCDPHDTLLAESLNNMALVHLAFGRADEAAPLFERALEILKRRRGSKSRAVAVLLDNLSIVYQAQGRYEESAALFREAESIRAESPGVDSSGEGY